MNVNIPSVDLGNVSVSNIPSVNLDSTLTSVTPYLVPIFVILVVLGVVFFVLRNVKLIAIIIVILVVLMLIGVIPKLQLDFFKSKVPSNIDLSKIKETPGVSSPSTTQSSGSNSNSFSTSDLNIGKKLSSGMVVNDQVVYNDDQKIFVGFSYSGAGFAKAIVVRLKHMQSGTESERTIYVTESVGSGMASFEKPEGGWKVGAYSISIIYDGEVESESAIQVVDAD